MLVHICCSVDSHFFLQKLQELYPSKKLIGYFYDPNIHPYSEYKLRLLDVKRSCKKLGIELIEGEYDFDSWCKAVRGLESEPEKGARCSVCFDDRLESTAKKAFQLGIGEITTTLLTSPKKSITQLRENAKKIEEKYSLYVSTPDFRVNGGTAEQFALAKKDKLYHQNYCGCLFALEVQREHQQRFKDELSSPITKQILPSSIESRIELYEQIITLEEEGREFFLQREKFLNYRVLRAYVKKEKKVIPSYFLFYSMMNRKYSKGKVEKIKNEIGYFNRENILFISIKKLNSILNKNYKSIHELMDRALKIEEELQLRKKLVQSDFVSLNPIIVLNEIELVKYELYLEAQTYTDTSEKIDIN